MPYASNGTTRLYWEEEGSGAPVLLIMGLSFTLEMWHRIRPNLAAQYRLVLFDNRGMGRSDVPPGLYSMRQMAADAVAVLDAAGIQSAHVVGASMGGMIAQELTLRYPDRVRSLVLGCTSYAGARSPWPDFRRVPRRFSLAEDGLLERERAIIPLLYSETTPLERVEEDLIIRARCRWSRKGFLRQFLAILHWSSFRRLPRIRVPTMVVHGDRDYLIPPGNGKVVASRIPGAHFVLIENAGHMLTTDQPEECRALITDFLEKCETSFVNEQAARGLVSPSA